MAEAALSFAVEQLGNLVIQKATSLLHVEEQVTQLKDELQAMQRFLRDAAEKQTADESIRGWISDIRDVAYDAEDAIESFALQIDAPRRRQGRLGRCVCFPGHAYHLDKLGKEIESIQKRLKDIGERRVRYGIQSLEEAKMVSSDRVERRRRVSPWHTDEHVVGLEEHVQTLLEKAVSAELNGLFVASIDGIGGVGKSTLAKKVYNHAAVGQQFDRRAWITVSRDFSPKDLLKELVLQLEPGGGVRKTMEDLSEESLERMVHQLLQGTRYFVVLDDVWRQEDWECIARVFPDERDKASRLLVTSRSRNIPRNARYDHELNGLNPDESWQLFLETTFIDEDNGKCPPKLEDIGKKIMEKCNGLPLAITIVAGLLLEQKQSVRGWEKVLKGIQSHVGEWEDNVSTILELSYWDLPPHLKSCFLCVSFFKEDALIRAKTLINIWIAEGIVPQAERREITMEEIARSYLDELINRNMVRAMQLFDKDGRIDEFCQLHDLLHDLSIKRAKEEINFGILSGEGTFDLFLDKARHLAISCNNKSFTSLESPNSHLRSLFLHSSMSNPNFLEWFGSNLRVLELEGLGLSKLPKRIGKLIGLRYLRLRYNDIPKLSRSIGHLNNLQILDILENWGELKVPNVIWKLDSLRHLYMPPYIKCEKPLKLNTLKNLQTLVIVSTENIVVEHLAEMVNLRELALVLATKDDVNQPLVLLANLENLDSLRLDWIESGVVLSLDGIVNLPYLTILGITGRLVHLPNNFPRNLSSLNLCDTYLKEDPMPILGRLPKLLHLQCRGIIHGGKQMVIIHNGFPNLRFLGLVYMRRPIEMYIEDGSLPELKQLEISCYDDVKILPKEKEMRMLSNLHNLTIIATKETVSILKSENYSRIIANIPSVDIRAWFA